MQNHFDKYYRFSRLMQIFYLKLIKYHHTFIIYLFLIHSSIRKLNSLFTFIHKQQTCQI